METTPGSDELTWDEDDGVVGVSSEGVTEASGVETFPGAGNVEERKLRSLRAMICDDELGS